LDIRLFLPAFAGKTASQKSGRVKSIQASAKKTILKTAPRRVAELHAA
jgi:hypothetical protein